MADKYRSKDYYERIAAKWRVYREDEAANEALAILGSDAQHRYPPRDLQGTYDSEAGAYADGTQATEDQVSLALAYKMSECLRLGLDPDAESSETPNGFGACRYNGSIFNNRPAFWLNEWTQMARTKAAVWEGDRLRVYKRAWSWLKADRRLGAIKPSRKY